LYVFSVTAVTLTAVTFFCLRANGQRDFASLRIFPMPTRPTILALSLLAFVAAPLCGADAKYLPSGVPDAVALLAPPPVAGSAEDRWEIDAAHRLHAAATPEQLARGTDEIKLTIFHFAPVIGDWFKPGKFPKTEALFTEVEAEAKVVTGVAKKNWQRIRPYHVEPALFPKAIEHEDRTDYCYPSGHSTRGTVFAALLAELFPDKRAALLEKGRDSGWLRVLGGVHYPEDVFAGRVLGQSLAREFLKSQKFQADLAAARAELAAGR
jgi:acid phosphatase (class A)